VHVPSDVVTTVRPSTLDVDILLELVPVSECTEVEGLAPVVVPDTLPPPAVTDDVIPPADADVFGGISPGLRWTVLQLPLGPDDEDVVLPSEVAELDELELSACAAMAITEASAIAPRIPLFILSSLASDPGGFKPPRVD
jgi:hypothetical protein